MIVWVLTSLPLGHDRCLRRDGFHSVDADQRGALDRPGSMVREPAAEYVLHRDRIPPQYSSRNIRFAGGWGGEAAADG